MPASPLLLLCILPATVTGSAELEGPLPCPSADHVLQYDDGTAHWLTWAGTYRGTWFDTHDFMPSSGGIEMDYAEYWFYHHEDYPWDTSLFWAELWNGPSSGPTTELDRELLQATHYTAVNVSHSGICTRRGFWCVVNTMLSSGGWPAVLGDDSPNVTDHSLFSRDFVVWEPWIIQGPASNDFLVRAVGTLGTMESATWGAIKGVCR